MVFGTWIFRPNAKVEAIAGTAEKTKIKYIRVIIWDLLLRHGNTATLCDEGHPPTG